MTKKPMRYTPKWKGTIRVRVYKGLATLEAVEPKSKKK